MLRTTDSSKITKIDEPDQIPSKGKIIVDKDLRESPAKKKIVFSLDYDGCLMSRQGKHPDPEQLNELLFNTNKDLIKKIIEIIAQNPDAEIEIIQGSNRQSIGIDRLNARSNKNSSGFKGLQTFVDVLNNLSPEQLAELYSDKEERKKVEPVFASLKKIMLNKYLISDTLYDKNPGANFDTALTRIDASSDDYFGPKEEDNVEFINCCFDEVKIPLLYGQLHYLSQNNPDTELLYYFFDDKPEILKAINKKFGQETASMPDISLATLHYLNKGKPQQLAMIQGTGGTTNTLKADLEEYEQQMSLAVVLYDLNVPNSEKAFALFGDKDKLKQGFNHYLESKERHFSASYNQRYVNILNKLEEVLEKFEQNKLSKFSTDVAKALPVANSLFTFFAVKDNTYSNVVVIELIKNLVARVKAHKAAPHNAPDTHEIKSILLQIYDFFIKCQKISGGAVYPELLKFFESLDFPKDIAETHHKGKNPENKATIEEWIQNNEDFSKPKIETKLLQKIEREFPGKYKEEMMAFYIEARPEAMADAARFSPKP